MYSPENVRIVLKRDDAINDSFLVVTVPAPKSEPNLESAFVFPKIGNGREEREGNDRELASVLSPYK